MWFKKVKHKKMQLFLTGIMLFAVAALFNMSLSLTGELSSFSKWAINEGNCPDGYILTIGTNNFEDHFINDNYLNTIKSVSGLSGRTVTAPIKCNGKDITQLYDMILSAKEWQDFGYLELKSGEVNSIGPGIGEVWLSEALTTPNNINLGDIITIQYSQPLELTVAGIYRTTCFPKGIGWAPMLVNAAELERTQSIEEAALFAVNISNYSSDKLTEMFENSEYSVTARSRDDVQLSLMEYSAAICAVGAIASLIIFVVAMVILWYIIKTNLMKEFKTIGIYKSLGYTSKNITQFYMIGYFLVSVVSVTLGILTSLKLVQVIGDILTEYVDGFGITKTSIIISISTFLSLIAVLHINIKIAFRKVEKITPVEAIAVGTTKAEQKLSKSILKYAKTPAEMAVNDLFKYKKTTAMMVLAITTSMFLTMFFQMIWFSADTILENKNLWFCMPKSDVYVAGDINEEVKNYLNNHHYVKSVVYGDFFVGNCKLKGYSNAPNYIRYDAYSEFSEETTGIRMLEGNGPESKNEVAVGTDLLKRIHLRVGDPIVFTLDGITKEYTISGSYETVSDSGLKIMLTTDAVAECKNYVSSRAFVQLENMDNYENFKKDAEDKFVGISVDTNWFAMENSVESIRGMLKSISMVLIVAFIAFSILNVLIVVLMDIKNWRRKHGIMKSLGFTAEYIMRQNASKYFMIAVVSAAFSFGLHLLISQRLAAFMIVDAFVNSYILIGLIIISFVILILLATVLINLSVNKISPLELMEE